jgi:rRNA maturation protein Nop10
MRGNASFHDLLTATATAPAGKPRLRRVLGLDVDLNWCVTAIQTGHGPIKPAQKWTRAQLLQWIREQVAAGHALHTVYEACGFGYTLREELTAVGALNVVTTPTRLSPERRRKNDRLDARELCVRPARHHDGHAHELHPIRIPTRPERERTRRNHLFPHGSEVSRIAHRDGTATVRTGS